MNLTSNITAITLGIRFSRSFRITDISGNIVDDILYGDNSPFGTKIFTHVQENTKREKIISNDKTDEYLRINTDDIILGKEIKKFDNDFDWIKKTILSYFKDYLFKKHGINNIIRIGIIFHHKLEKNDKFEEIVSQITNKDIKDLKNINVSFSKKLPALAGLKKDVNDYKNTIYEFNDSKNYLYANLDYQHYYNPVVQDLRDCSPENKLESAKSYLKDNFYKWLSLYDNKKK